MIDIAPFCGWSKNLRLRNEAVELLVTLEVGPRILSYALHGKHSPLNIFADQAGASGESIWRIRGGHRLWIAPEDRASTYFPDNTPVAWEQTGEFAVRLAPRPETTNGIQKQLDIALSPQGSAVTLTHRITRIAAGGITLAPWALTVMNAGGVGIVPQPPPGEHPRDLLPNRRLILWPYTDMADPRWNFGPDYLLLRHDASRGPTKIGLALQSGCCGHFGNGVLFIKKFPWRSGAAYPDDGCNFELFANARMMEIESLGPLVRLRPGEVAEHVEHWELHAADVAHEAIPQWLAAHPDFFSK
jgi:hypothetical protein